MSDSTATAREPSMEDILASIRRIIDEEDSRDARPAADLAVESTDEMQDASSLPVMSAAPVSREEGAADDEDRADRDERSFKDLTEAVDPDDESIFPERESPFWSRATGRNHDTDGDSVQEPETSDDDSTVTTPSDIFTRAQNKLGSTARPSARERMQSLAARAEQRANEADFADVPDLPDGNSTDYHAIDLDEASTSPAREADDDLPSSSIDDMAGIDATNVLDLTNPIDGSEASRSALIARAGDVMDRKEDNFDPDHNAMEPVVEMPSEHSDVTEDEHVSEHDPVDSRVPDETGHDVLDLTTPIDLEPAQTDMDRLENGESFTVSSVDLDEKTDLDAVDAGDEDKGGIEDAISQNLAADHLSNELQDDREPDESELTEVEAETADTEDHSAMDHGLSGKTYSRFDSEDEHEEDTADIPEGETAEDYSAAFMMLEDDHSRSPGSGVTDEHSDDDPVEESLDAFASDDEEDEMDDKLGFSDTFGASDVYHDDPPVLDEDYSRSLEPADGTTSAEDAYAASSGTRDGDMEMVGGMVRDAMERDPVDYADPAALVSMTSEELSARALASLADVEGEASRRVYGSLRISEDGTSESLEGMVRGMLRPMLREWLDDNLPSMVESAVRGEVERISAKSRKYSRASEKD